LQSPPPPSAVWSLSIEEDVAARNGVFAAVGFLIDAWLVEANLAADGIQHQVSSGVKV